MFDLEKSIADWRKQMLAAGIKSPVPLEELEIHLREEIERQTKSGASEHNAFEVAVEKIGQPGKLKTEFKKADTRMEMRFVQLAGIASGAVAGLFSLWILFVLLTVHEATLAERLLGLAGIAAIILSWRHGHRFFPVIPNRLIRMMIEIACCLSSVGGMILFIKFIPSFLGHIPPGQMLVSILWAWSAIAILGVFAYRFDEAAGQKEN